MERVESGWRVLGFSTRVENIVGVDARHTVWQPPLRERIERGEHAQVEGGQRRGQPPRARLQHARGKA